jgi:eukaryotic-like serine/threonine-protein kinase
MRPKTPCPHPVHLRMFVRDPDRVHQADSMRAHLKECANCQALAVRFQDDNGSQHTQSDHELSPADERALVKSQTDPVVARAGADNAVQTTVADRDLAPARSRPLPPNFGDTIEFNEADQGAQPTLADRREGGRDRPSGRPRDGDGGIYVKTKDAEQAQSTVEISAAPADGSDESDFQLIDTPAAPTGAAQNLHDPTCEFVPDDNSSQNQDQSQGQSQQSAPDSIVPRTLVDTGRRVRSTSALLENVIVPGYDILAELGRGGMGVVYKARHRRLQRLVALKMVLAGAHVGAVGLARFRAEAEAVAKLSHTNIVQIYETGEHEGRPFFSLEYVEGGSLDQRLIESPTSPRGAAQLIETLARTMQTAHERGIVHRDLKPANILLAKAGKHSTVVRDRDPDSLSLPGDHWSKTSIPKIADFGLAKQVDDDSSQTKSGTILGTPSYMAPEQASGKNREIGPAADIYSLGAIFYELLVGRPPFRAGNPIDTIRQVLEQEPVPPRQLEPRVPLDLETICLKCLEKDPARRYGTSLELADDLQRFIEGHPIQARPTPAWERAWKWGRRRKAVVALLGVTAMAILGGGLFVVWHNVSLRGKLDVALTQERHARQRELDARREKELAVLLQEGQRLFDSARLAVAAGDWAAARLDLEKTLATIGNEASLDSVKEPALALLKQVENELRIESDRKASRARLQNFGKLRDEAQFLGTLYTGMDLAANLAAARASVEQALAVYQVMAGNDAKPRFDTHLSDAQKAEIQGDCSQLLLILAETDAQSTAISGKKAPDRDEFLKKALAHLEQARRLGAPERAFHLRRARYLRMLGDSGGAAQEETAAQAAGSDDVVDHFMMADELYRRERFGEAIQEFDRVLERKPGHFWAQYLNALCLLRQDRPGEARALLSACLAARSDFVWLYLLRGFAQQELKAWDAALADFQKAAQMPLDDNARYVLFVNRGVLRVRTERLDDAVADLSAAIEVKPAAYQAYVNLAQAFRGQGKPERALGQLDRAITLEPAVAHLYRLRSRLYIESNQPDRALADLDRAIGREKAGSPYQVDDQVERGRLLLASGKPAESLACFDAALALKKDHALAQRLRAEVLFRLGRFKEVVDAFDRYLETGKPLESVYRGRGLARAELGQYPGAIEDFTKAIELGPSSAVQAFRGWTHLVVDAPKLALRDFELAIELDSKNGDAYNGKGIALARLGRHREALEEAALALRNGPSSPRLYYNAARIYAQCPGPYPRRALELVRQALDALPAEERRGFWSTHVEKDQALAALHRHPLYIKLENELSRGQD